jgi:hypothetical protein
MIERDSATLQKMVLDHIKTAEKQVGESFVKTLTLEQRASLDTGAAVALFSNLVDGFIKVASTPEALKGMLLMNLIEFFMNNKLKEGQLNSMINVRFSAYKTVETPDDLKRLLLEDSMRLERLMEQLKEWFFVRLSKEANNLN